MKANCDYCMNFYYDDEYENWFCAVDMDQDDMERFLVHTTDNCPYFRFGDDHTLPSKQ